MKETSAPLPAIALSLDIQSAGDICADPCLPVQAASVEAEAMASVSEYQPPSAQLSDIAAYSEGRIAPLSLFAPEVLSVDMETAAAQPETGESNPPRDIGEVIDAMEGEVYFIADSRAAIDRITSDLRPYSDADDALQYLLKFAQTFQITPLKYFHMSPEEMLRSMHFVAIMADELCRGITFRAIEGRYSVDVANLAKTALLNAAALERELLERNELKPQHSEMIADILSFHARKGPYYYALQDMRDRRPSLKTHVALTIIRLLDVAGRYDLLGQKDKRDSVLSAMEQIKKIHGIDSDEQAWAMGQLSTAIYNSTVETKNVLALGSAASFVPDLAVIIYNQFCVGLSHFSQIISEEAGRIMREHGLPQYAERFDILAEKQGRRLSNLGIIV